MNHPDKKKARGIDTPGRCRRFTDAVYSGEGDAKALYQELIDAERSFYPNKPEYNVYFGEMHGHTNLSDGNPDIDSYFRHLRDEAKVDFAAISDHDHGGVGRKELWVGSPSKWDIIKSKCREYDEPGKFTALLAYERDSYPYYNNMILYYKGYDGEMYRGAHDGEITEAELRSLLQKEDIIVIPHDTYYLSAGADFNAIPLDLIPPLIEIYSRGDATEYFGNPANDLDALIEGGYWQDALRKGAHMGCIAGSDDHFCQNGTITDAPYPHNYPGLTGVYAKENTNAAIFEAIKAKRTFAFMGGRMKIDFRINGHYMGEQFALKPGEDRSIYFHIEADSPVKQVAIVKNLRNYCLFRKNELLFFDYRVEKDEDCYYLRVELEDGRFGWTSPIWIKTN